MKTAILPLATVLVLVSSAAASEPRLPLQPSRTILFATDEVTWGSLDVSPDGKTILFEMLGDLYTMPVAGGTARQLTKGMAFDSQPRFSPDGHSIVFVSDRGGAENLWVARADGTQARQLSRDYWSFFTSPAWSADGRSVVVSHGKVRKGGLHYMLWSYPLDGAAPFVLAGDGESPVGPKLAQALGATMTRDGRLFFARGEGTIIRANNVSGSFPSWKIVQKIGNDEIDVIEVPGSAFRPLASPDGRWLAYGTRRDGQTQLYLRDLATGKDRLVVPRLSRDELEGYPTRDLLPGYAFTPDGEALILAFEKKIHRVGLRDGSDSVIPFNAAVAQQLGPLLNPAIRVSQTPSFRSRFAFEPRLSPDGRQIAFTTMNRIQIAEVGKGLPREVARINGEAFQPVWSPDGRWLAYVTWSATGGHVWKIDVAGTRSPERLSAHTAFYANPLWSRDGNEIFVLTTTTENRLKLRDWGRPLAGLTLIAFAADGGAERKLIDAGNRVRTRDEPDAWLQLGPLHLGPDPGRIYAHAGGGLMSVRADGSDVRIETEVTGRRSRNLEETPGSSIDIRISPDGRWLLASISRWLYIVAMPQQGMIKAINLETTPLPHLRLTDVGADSFAWEEGGRTIAWSLGSRYYRLPLSKITRGNQLLHSAPVPPATEQDLSIVARRATPVGAILLRGASVITMRGEEVFDRADLLINGNRIAAIGRSGTVKVPLSAHVVDVTGKTIIPGLIDVHAHVGPAQRNILERDNNWALLANLAFGVTTLRDPSTHGGDVVGIADLVEAGEILGPRYYSTATAIKSTHDFRSLGETTQTLRRNSDFYSSHTLKAYLLGNRRQQQWAAMASQRLGLFPTSEGGADVKGMLATISDGFGGLEHNFPITPLGKDVTEFVARSGTAWTPVLSINYGAPWAMTYFSELSAEEQYQKLQRFLPQTFLEARTAPKRKIDSAEYQFGNFAADAAQVLKDGGLVGVGGHGEVPGISTHWEMWALHADGRGLSPHDVLRAATISGARAIGVDRDLGSIEPGKLADLLILDGNPLEDLRATVRISYVMRNGELYDGQTLDRLLPTPRPLPARWWQLEPKR